MSKYDGRRNPSKKAVALQYEAGNNAPLIVASGMGYEDNSLATILTQLKLGQEVPEELYKAIVEIYVYFLHFDPNRVKEGSAPKAAPKQRQEQPGPTEQEE